MDNFNLKKYLTENKLIKEQADHVSPMVAKAYRDYIKAKKDSAADVDFAEDPEKAYRYYSKKLNNTYSTRADRDAIEAILKKKYGSALEEQDTITKMTDFGPIDVPNTKKYIKKSPEEMTMKELIARVEELEKGKFSNENARELKDLRAELSYRQNFKNESLNSDLKNAKNRLKDPHTIEDIEYRKTNKGDKFVKIIYKKKHVPGKMMDTGPHFVSVFYNDENELQKIGKDLKLKLKESVNEGYGIKTTIAVRNLLTDDFIENIENLAGIKIDNKGFDVLDKFFLEFISKNKIK